MYIPGLHDEVGIRGFAPEVRGSSVQDLGIYIAGLQLALEAYDGKTLPADLTCELLRDIAERHADGNTNQEAGSTSIVVNEEVVADYLKPREYAVFELISSGYSHKETAKRVFLSPNTVENYAPRIRDKLGAVNMTHTVRRAFELGLWEAPDRPDYQKYLHLYASLTVRDKHLIDLLSQGYSQQDIATKWFVVIGTVDKACKKMLDKFAVAGANNRTAAARLAIEAGVVRVPKI